MATIESSTETNPAPVTDEEAATLGQGFRGTLLRPDDVGYDAARAVWNGMIDRRPSIIARCLGTGDVVAAVRFARTTGRLLAIRGGGHSAAGNGTCDDGVLIDLSLMRAVSVDPVAATARAQGGALWGDFDRETQLFGLATPGGLISQTGIAGLTLGGGIGWLSRRHGLSSDNLRAVELVDAEGAILQVDAKNHPDLFWALRGGGGNFGVVTAFEFDLHPVGPMILGGIVAWPADQAGSVLRFLRTFVNDLPVELGIAAGLTTAPSLPFISEDVHGERIIAVMMCWTGDHDEGLSRVASLRAHGTPVIDLVTPLPYTVMQSFNDHSAPHGRRTYWKAGWIDDLSDPVVDALVAAHAAMPSSLSTLEVGLFDGASTEVAAGETAFGSREPGFVYNIVASWEDTGQDEANISWTRATYQSLQAHERGSVYVNFLAADDAGRLVDAYEPAIYRRLAAVKHQYDPTNFFRVNHNILPEPAEAGAQG